MATPLHFVGLSGSLRKNSFNTSVLNACFSLLPEGVTLEIASIADLPLYNADMDIPAVIERPTAVKRFRETLSRADGFVIVSPDTIIPFREF